MKVVLERLLRLIRFPCMTPEQFVQVSRTGLLDAQERCEVFEYLLSDELLRRARCFSFSSAPRCKPPYLVLKRFVTLRKSNVYSGDCSVMKIFCNKDIYLNGFGISSSCYFDAIHDVQLTVKEDKTTLINQNILVPPVVADAVHPIHLTTPLLLLGTQMYSVIITFNFAGVHGQGVCWRGRGSPKVVSIQDHLIEFDRSDSGSLISQILFTPSTNHPATNHSLH